jgi:hypothetical protein
MPYFMWLNAWFRWYYSPHKFCMVCNFILVFAELMKERLIFENAMCCRFMLWMTWRGKCWSITFRASHMAHWVTTRMAPVSGSRTRALWLRREFISAARTDSEATYGVIFTHVANRETCSRHVVLLVAVVPPGVISDYPSDLCHLGKGAESILEVWLPIG